MEEKMNKNSFTHEKEFIPESNKEITEKISENPSENPSKKNKKKTDKNSSKYYIVVIRPDFNTFKLRVENRYRVVYHNHRQFVAKIKRKKLELFCLCSYFSVSFKDFNCISSTTFESYLPYYDKYILEKMKDIRIYVLVKRSEYQNFLNEFFPKLSSTHSSVIPAFQQQLIELKQELSKIMRDFENARKKEEKQLETIKEARRKMDDINCEKVRVKREIAILEAKMIQHGIRLSKSISDPSSSNEDF